MLELWLWTDRWWSWTWISPCCCDVSLPLHISCVDPEAGLALCHRHRHPRNRSWDIVVCQTCLGLPWKTGCHENWMPCWIRNCDLLIVFRRLKFQVFWCGPVWIGEMSFCFFLHTIEVKWCAFWDAIHDFYDIPCTVLCDNKNVSRWHCWGPL